MDNNGKLFGKISIIDLFVVLIVVAVAAGTFHRFTASGADFTRGETTINFVIRVEGPREFTIENYYAGQRVYDRRTNQFIGILTDFWAMPHYANYVSGDGSIVQAARPGEMTLYLAISAQGRATPTSIYVEGTYEITANSIISIATRYVQVEGRVFSVDVAE